MIFPLFKGSKGSIIMFVHWSARYVACVLFFFLKLLISASKTIRASVYEPATTGCVEFLWGRKKGNVSPVL